MKNLLTILASLLTLFLGRKNAKKEAEVEAHNARAEVAAGDQAAVNARIEQARISRRVGKR